MFAKRTGWTQTPNELTRRLAALRGQKAEILDLTESNPTRCGFRSLSEPLFQKWADPRNLIYAPEPKGLMEAREAISADYAARQIRVDPEHILLTASTSEAYAALFKLLANPGDRILFPRPSYPLFQFLAELADVQLDFYSLIYDDGAWHVDFNSLVKKIQPNTKAIVIVNPNNPTGNFLKTHEWPQLVRICQYKKLALISDEVFSDYAWNREPVRIPSVAGNPDILTFALNGISKMLLLPQMKLAWMAASGPEKLRDDAVSRLEIILDTYLSVNTPVQRALPEWLKLRPVIQKEIIDRILENKRALEEAAAGSPCELLRADGGWYAALKLPDVKNEESWVLELLGQNHVLVHPGYFFDFPAEAFVVLSLIVPPAVFREGINRILARASQGKGV